jgi:hypothetical protein
MRQRPSLLLVLLTLLAAPPAHASSSPDAAALPAVDPALATEAQAAMASIQREAAALRAAHPGLPPVNAPRRQETSMPLMALDEAARGLALLRVHAALAPDAEGHATRPLEESRAWVAQFRAGILANASQQVERSRAVRAPPPGPELEGAVLRWLPAYHVAARDRDLGSLAHLLPASESGDLRPLVAEAARLEMYRVLWEHRPPAVPEVAANASALTLRQVDAMRARGTLSGASTGITPESSFTQDALMRVSMERAANRAFGALAFTVVAEQAIVQANATAHAVVRGLDLRPQVELEAGALPGETSPLMRYAQESAASALQDVPDTGAAALGNASRYGAALGDLAAFRLVRGLPRPPDVATAAATTPPVGASAPGPGLALAVALVALLADRRQRARV